MQFICVAFMGFGEPIRRSEVEVGVENLKNGKTLEKDEVAVVMIKGDRVVD